MPLSTHKLLIIAALAGAGALGPLALGTQAPRADVKPPPAAVPVSVETLAARDIRVWSSFSGRARAVDFAEIRPEVSGKIVDIRFTDGQMVQAGQVLMVIDPQPYEAAAARAEANLASATARAEYSRKDLERAKSLIGAQTLTQRDFDARANALRVAEADIKAAEAALRQARIDLDRAYVKAPISGRISRAEITLGNLVQSGANAPLLTSVVSQNGVYVDFDVDEQTYLKIIRASAKSAETEKAIPVEVSLQGDEGHPIAGLLSSFDNRINTGTGAIRARARFANGDGALVPGMFVSVRLGGGAEQRAVLVSERAVGNDQSKKFVYVVGADDKVAYREVSLGPQVDDGRRIVRAGLAPGDRVIVDGLQHVRPDTRVHTREAAVH
ncbi:multidrug efflux system membrane fusion protein [Rhodoblastus acidophilus]|uniref:efflux RND transporter periplasmic adaptor subunit n=1 Tax=Rhodoblastus acidophilus TaxID=1074 RepID=UPI002224ED78|nr:efflux RND transporter periplasmic adaptor subunit [Rhodoblastus acidophilus]MCW2286846.1 multidrug efflux system membrane fusion protein [Rhodoblastus acidophilus]MCW2335706.1 multidrug efflux system membrane fusion protein [Rhodoblastus acidophilus]